MSRLVCDKSLTLGEVVGISISASSVGLVLLAYCLYVAWSGRWGLPKLERVSDGATNQYTKNAAAAQ